MLIGNNPAYCQQQEDYLNFEDLTNQNREKSTCYRFYSETPPCQLLKKLLVVTDQHVLIFIVVIDIKYRFADTVALQRIPNRTSNDPKSVRRSVEGKFHDQMVKGLNPALRKIKEITDIVQQILAFQLLFAANCAYYAYLLFSTGQHS